MRTLSMINSTVDTFFEDSPSRTIIKLYLYQSVLNWTQTKACDELGITSKRGSFLSKLRIELFKKKESDFFKKHIECERICASEFHLMNIRGFRNHKKKVNARTGKRIFKIYSKGLPELPKRQKQN